MSLADLEGLVLRPSVRGAGGPRAEGAPMTEREQVFTYAAPALKFGSGASAEVGHDRTVPDGGVVTLTNRGCVAPPRDLPGVVDANPKARHSA